MPTDRYGNEWTREELEEFAEEAADLYGVPSAGLIALITQESAWNPNAVSPVGAQGIAQFMPATAAEWGVDPWDPLQSIEGAAKYLRWLRSVTPSWTAALAAYNWGVGNVTRQISALGRLDLASMPKETRNYVQKLAPEFGENPNAENRSADADAENGVPVAALLLAAGVAVAYLGQ